MQNFFKGYQIVTFFKHSFVWQSQLDGTKMALGGPGPCTHRKFMKIHAM